MADDKKDGADDGLYDDDDDEDDADDDVVDGVDSVDDVVGVGVGELRRRLFVGRVESHSEVAGGGQRTPTGAQRHSTRYLYQSILHQAKLEGSFRGAARVLLPQGDAEELLLVRGGEEDLERSSAVLHGQEGTSRRHRVLGGKQLPEDPNQRPQHRISGLVDRWIQ